MPPENQATTDCFNFALLLFGAGVIGYGLYKLAGSVRLARRYDFGLGTVTRLIREGSGRHWRYVIVVMFKDRKGRPVELRVQSLFNSRGAGWPAFYEGQVVPIRYDPTNPKLALIDSVIYLWLAPLLLIAFGAGAIFFIFTR